MVNGDSLYWRKKMKKLIVNIYDPIYLKLLTEYHMTRLKGP